MQCRNQERMKKLNENEPSLIMKKTSKIKKQ